jgi:hypothetical protein
MRLAEDESATHAPAPTKGRVSSNDVGMHGSGRLRAVALQTTLMWLVSRLVIAAIT